MLVVWMESDVIVLSSSNSDDNNLSLFRPVPQLLGHFIKLMIPNSIPVQVL